MSIDEQDMKLDLDLDVNVPDSKNNITETLTLLGCCNPPTSKHNKQTNDMGFPESTVAMLVYIFVVPFCVLVLYFAWKVTCDFMTYMLLEEDREEEEEERNKAFFQTSSVAPILFKLPPDIRFKPQLVPQDCESDVMQSSTGSLVSLPLKCCAMGKMGFNKSKRTLSALNVAHQEDSCTYNMSTSMDKATPLDQGVGVTRMWQFLTPSSKYNSQYSNDDENTSLSSEKNERRLNTLQARIQASKRYWDIGRPMDSSHTTV